MSRSDDSSGDMSRFPSSLEADRLLSGRLSPDDLPDEAAPLARLLAGMVPGAANDPFTERRIVSDMTAEILRNPAPETMPSLLRSSGSRVSAKAGALAFVAVLATGTAAAAANGSLPAGIQRAVSDALSHVSISVPRPAPHRPQPVESQHGGPDGSLNGGSPGGTTGPVGPRGVENGKDGGETPRGPTNATPGSRPPGKGDNGNHNGPPSSVPNGPKTTNPGGSNVNKGSGNNSGQHNGADNGKKKGQDDPNAVTTTTVKTNNGKAPGKGKDASNAGGNGQQNGNADSHASPEVSGRGRGRT
jgi:hypothetical protein